MFKSPKAQWESILTKPLKKQIKFLNEVCKVNRNDSLMIRGAFFKDLIFNLVRQIFKLVDNVVDAGGMDPSFRELIFDRLLWVSEVAHLYPEDKQVDNNIISGESYHVYTSCYYDLKLIVNFLNTHTDINSLCDLGSGSGRAIFYMALETRDNIDFLGLELIEQRVEFTNAIANHFELNNVNFKTSDFLDNPDDFDGRDAYYLFDPVGTDDVELLVSYFKKMIDDGSKFYIIFISGWDDLLHNALNSLESLEKLSGHDSAKQEGRVVNFYKVK